MGEQASMACETPLVELLRATPVDARLTYEHSPTSHSMIPVGLYSHRAADQIAALEAERDTLAAEVAKLRAACAAKDAALRMLDTYFNEQGNAPLDSNLIYAGLSTDAGKGWIDATGAVEVVVGTDDMGHYGVDCLVPDDWAGSRVLIVRVAK